MNEGFENAQSTKETMDRYGKTIILAFSHSYGVYSSDEEDENRFDAYKGDNTPSHVNPTLPTETPNERQKIGQAAHLE